MKNQLTKEFKIYRRRAITKRRVSKLNFLKNKQKKTPNRGRKKREFARPKRIEIPAIFSMQDGLIGVLSFFQTLSNLHKLDIKQVFFDFSKVTKLSNGAITILLSYIGWLNDHGILASGNYPDDQAQRDFFRKSGFLTFFKTLESGHFEKTLNTIVARGQQQTDSAMTAKIIRNTTFSIWGVRDRNLKLQGMLIELMANTVNHAYFNQKNQKGWYFSVNHLATEKKVKCCFVDNGAGILNTIHLKFPDKISKLVGNKNDSEILQEAFEGQFGSRTLLSHRGRGLKAIKRVFDLGHISELKVLTNNVFYDFEKGESINLSSHFQGTFYFWEINENCNR